jgi:hypothetical protein
MQTKKKTHMALGIQSGRDKRIMKEKTLAQKRYEVREIEPQQQFCVKGREKKEEQR